MGFIKYPNNCFLCFNIKNVITFSVIFNNNGSIQSLFWEKIIFLSKNFEMSQNRSVTISLRATLRTKMRFRSHFETFPTQGSTGLPVRSHPLVRTSESVDSCFYFSNILTIPFHVMHKLIKLNTHAII